MPTSTRREIAFFDRSWLAITLALTCAGCAAATARSGSQGSGASTRAADAAATAEQPETGLDDRAALELGAADAGSSSSSFDFDAEWAWVKTQFPEAEGFLPRGRPALLVAILDWAKDGRPTKVFDLACRAITVNRVGNQLAGRLFPQVEIHGRKKTVSAPEVTFGDVVVVTCGSTEEYDRQGDGTWKLISSGGYGCADTVSYGLSRVTADAAWYGGARVRLSLQCVEKVEESAPCNGGGARTCTRCGKWAIQAISSSPMMGIRTGQRPPRSIALETPADCQQPCPVDEHLAIVRRAERAMHGHSFFVDGLIEYPFLFRTHAACVEYRRHNAVPKSELEPWW